MSRYIATKQYRGTGLCGQYLVIRYGQELEERGGILYWNDLAVCAAESENGFRHFSWDEDGRGKERGAITYAIFAGDGGRSWAFSDAENETMRTKWGAYLRPLSDTNIVNADFFRAPVETLEEIARDLHFAKRGGRYRYTGTGPDRQAKSEQGQATAAEWEDAVWTVS